MPIKSFRGKITDGGIDTVVLHTNTGSTGYKITKFELMHAEPGEQHAEHTMKIYSIPQTSADNTIDFSDNTLLASAYLIDNEDRAYPVSTAVVFDNMVFNQDIYITHVDTGGSQPCNYYIELEQIKLALDENTVATLKDIRNFKSNPQ
tara:strand:+ start:465 stop:908 length:444 start_codon:yes stop_codon:yes gene_type:complete